jgi:hypothetical protein
MLMVALQITLMLIAIFLPLSTARGEKKGVYNIDNDTSEATYAINENGKLERVNAHEKKSRIKN